MLYICSKCGIEKPTTEFYKHSASTRGLQYHCKPCNDAASCAWRRANPEKGRAGARARAVKRRAKNPEAVRNSQLKNKYGIALAQYNVLLDSQNAVCAICQEPCHTGRALAVDHCHETGRIRGLLCNRCNQAIGILQDSPHNCLAAAKYLQQTKQISTPRVDSVGYMSPC